VERGLQDEAIMPVRVPTDALAILALFGAVACGQTDAADAKAASESSQSIVSGGTSGPQHDAVVQIARDGSLSCTGTLIAPNLVLTARHCVAGEGAPESEDGCALGRTLPASSFAIKLGAAVDTSGRVPKPDARGSRVFTTTRASICSFDVALIQLDRALAGAKVAKVRFTPLARGEDGLVAVGYGVNGRTQDLPDARRSRGRLAVLAVGPASATFRQRSGDTVPYDVPENDVATGESTCNGDSGGPLFDAQMNIVGVTSRGLPVPNSCLDLPAIYAGVAGHADLIRGAAAAAGASLDGVRDPEAAPPATPDPEATGREGDEVPDPNVAEAAAPSATDAQDEEAVAEEPDAPKKRTSTKKKKVTGESDDDASDGATRTGTPLATSGCSAAPRSTRGGAGLGALAALVVLSASLRRRARRAAAPSFSGRRCRTCPRRCTR
jgi:hypothetical protein